MFFTMMTPPVTFLLLTTGTYKISIARSVGGSEKFDSFPNFAQFCWSWLPLVVAPWFFFMFWHYPFYKGIEGHHEIFVMQREQIKVGPVPASNLSMNTVADTTDTAVASSSPSSSSESTPLSVRVNVNSVEVVAASSSSTTTSSVPLNFHTFVSMLGCAAFICFTAMEFTGAPTSGTEDGLPSNFLSASGLGFLLQCQARGFNARLTAFGFFQAGSLLLVNGAWWAVYSFCLISTFLWGLLFIMATVWLILVMIQCWRRGAGGRMHIFLVVAVLVTGLTFLFLWIFHFDKHAFFPPPNTVPYRRQICVKNSCSKSLVVGVTGGSTGIPCSEGCPNGTVCNTIESGTHQCFFDLSLSGKVLHKGDKLCVDLPDPVQARITPPHHAVILQEQTWSGNIYARTHCDNLASVSSNSSSNNSTARHGCKTGLCGSSCSVVSGPTGPTTLAEMTLTAQQDYFDVSVINGINLPISITPFNEMNSFIPNPDLAANPTTATYWCTAAGASGAPWSFPSSSATEEYRLVVPSSEASPTPCTTSASCGSGEVCGTAMVLVRGPEGDVWLPTDQTQKVCGELAGLWTLNELCAWTAGQYGPCNGAAGSSGTLAQLLGCYGPDATSCFQNTASANCCGCSTWSSLGLSATKQCVSTNPDWHTYAEPSLKWLKQGASSSYVYPFDDTSSSYVCAGYSASSLKQENLTIGNVSLGSTTNDASYEIEYCPGGVDVTLT